MIFYFTGTGNSYYVAKKIAEKQSERLISIAAEMDKPEREHLYEAKENELIGFVYPIYAWGAPQIVLDFISNIKITGDLENVFSVNTCGSQEGNATKKLNKKLTKVGLNLTYGFSISMPSNYIIGEDVESKDIQEKKLKKADERIKRINQCLSVRIKGSFDLLKGDAAALKSSFTNPLFNKFARTTKPFFATDDCISCGLCEKICPIHTIKMQKGQKPVWNKACTQCLACINLCPVKAIQYGEKTRERGRYKHPEYKNV